MPAYAGPTPADPFGSGHVFDIFDVMEQAELNAAPAPATARPPRPGQPATLASAALGGRLVAADAGRRTPPPIAPTRPPAPESWALPSRPFMLRRDRHAPRWGQRRGGADREPKVVDVAPLADGAATPQGRPVPIEAGPPPPAIEPALPETAAVTVTAAQPQATGMSPAAEAPAHSEAPAEPVAEASSQTAAVETEAVQAELTQTEPTQAEPTQAEPAPSAEATVASDPIVDAAPEPAAQPEPQPVPANDVVSGPVVQPIVIGSQSCRPPERKRGWWRRL